VEQRQRGTIISIDNHIPVIDRYYQPGMELLGEIATNIDELARHLRPRTDDPTANPLVTEVQDALLEAKETGCRAIRVPHTPHAAHL